MSIRALVFIMECSALFLSDLATRWSTRSQKCFSGIRDHRDALVVFGRESRHPSGNASLAVRKVDRPPKTKACCFLTATIVRREPEDADCQMEGRSIDAVSSRRMKKQPRLLRDLEGSVPSRVRSQPENDDRTPGYVLLTRSKTGQASADVLLRFDPVTLISCVTMIPVSRDLHSRRLHHTHAVAFRVRERDVKAVAGDLHRSSRTLPPASVTFFIAPDIPTAMTIEGYCAGISADFL